MNIIFAIVVVAGMIIHSTPSYNGGRDECVKDVQEVGYSAIKSQVEENEKSTVKIYCIDPKKDYAGMEKITASDLKDADLVPEITKEFKGNYNGTQH